MFTWLFGNGYMVWSKHIICVGIEWKSFGKVDYLIKLVKLSATALSLTLPLIRTLLKKSSAVDVNNNSTVWTWVSLVHYYVFLFSKNLLGKYVSMKLGFQISHPLASITRQYIIEYYQNYILVEKARLKASNAGKTKQKRKICVKSQKSLLKVTARGRQLICVFWSKEKGRVPSIKNKIVPQWLGMFFSSINFST